MKKFLRYFGFVILFAILVASCTDDVAISRGPASIVFSNNHGMEKTLRTKNPDEEIYGVEDCYWKYTATCLDNPSAFANTTTLTSVKPVGKTGLGTVGGFEAGRWKFVLYAYKDAEFTTLLYRSAEIEKNLKANTNTTVEFPVSKVTDAGEGKIQIVTSGPDAIKLQDSLGHEIFDLRSVVCGSVTLTSATDYLADVNPGTYSVVLEFDFEGAHYIANPTVKVYSNFTTLVCGELDGRQVDSYNIIYMNSDGSEVSSFTDSWLGDSAPRVHVYGEDTVLQEPFREYFEFRGWFKDSALGPDNNITFVPKRIHEDYTVYAWWVPIPSWISCSFNAKINGENDPTLVSGPATFSYGFDEEVVLQNPTRTGYTFDGWSGTEIETTQLNVIIPVGSRGDRAYKAHWFENDYTIAYDVNHDYIRETYHTTWPSQNVLYTQKTTLADGFNDDRSPMVPGFSFKGWTRDSSGTDVQYSGKQEVSKLSSILKDTVMFYALWDATGTSTYKVEYFFEHFKNDVTTETEWPQDSYVYVRTDASAGAKVKGDVYPTPTDTYGYHLNTAKGNYEDIVSANDDTVFELYYDYNEHNLKWLLNGGTVVGGEVKDDVYKYNQKINIPSRMFKEGYTFKEWKMLTSSGTISDDDWDKVTPPEYMPDGDITFDAQWTANTYYIRYNKNGADGTQTMANTTMTYDVARTLSPVAFTKTGYTFSWWEDRNGTTYTNIAEVKNLTSATNDVFELKAIWEPNKYRVIFNRNNSTASGDMNDQYFTYDEEQRLSANLFTKTGYLFGGWYTNSGCTGDCYADETSVTNLTSDFDGIVYLYAKWNPVHYYIQFTSNTAVSGDMPNQELEYDKSVAINANAFIKPGYTFTGWIDEDGTPRNDKGSVKNLSDIQGKVLVFEAQWSANRYTIKYDKNDSGASGAMGAKAMVYDESAQLDANSFTKRGYLFDGWNTEKDGSGTSFTDMTTVSNLTTASNGVVSLYAQWKPIHYTIKFTSNTGMGEMEDQNFTYDVEQKLSKNLFTKTGYSFTGWKNSNSTASYEDETSVTNLCNTDNDVYELVAQWQADTYTITLDANGGFSYSGTYTRTKYDSNVLEDFTAVSALNGILTGYYTAAEGGYCVIAAEGILNKGVTDYTDSDGKWIRTTNTVLYAHWISKGTPSVASTDVYLDMTCNGTYNPSVHLLGAYSVRNGATRVTTISNLTCIGTTGIEGFYTDVSCSAGNKVLNGDGSIVSGEVAGYVKDGKWNCVRNSVTLYAKWSETSYTIKFNSNGGTRTMTDINARVNESVELPDVEFTRTGYTFVNWNTNADGSGTAYANNSFVKDLTTTSGGTVTLYAQWKANKTTIYLKDKEGIAQGTAVATYNSSELVYTVSPATTHSGDKTFDGFFTRLNAGADGDRRVIDGSGNLIADVSGYTDSTGKWICTETGIQLYARWH